MGGPPVSPMSEGSKAGRAETQACGQAERERERQAGSGQGVLRKFVARSLGRCPLEGGRGGGGGGAGQEKLPSGGVHICDPLSEKGP